MPQETRSLMPSGMRLTTNSQILKSSFKILLPEKKKSLLRTCRRVGGLFFHLATLNFIIFPKSKTDSLTFMNTPLARGPQEISHSLLMTNGIRPFQGTVKHSSMRVIKMGTGIYFSFNWIPGNRQD